MLKILNASQPTNLKSFYDTRIRNKHFDRLTLYTVVINGENDVHVQTHATLHIPKEHHRFVLGPKGKKLNLLELETATKINIPRPNDQSDVITIQGTRDGIDRAKHEIQLISDEQVCAQPAGQVYIGFDFLPFIPSFFHSFDHLIITLCTS